MQILTIQKFVHTFLLKLLKYKIKSLQKLLNTAIIKSIIKASLRPRRSATKFITSNPIKDPSESNACIISLYP